MLYLNLLDNFGKDYFLKTITIKEQTLHLERSEFIVGIGVILRNKKMEIKSHSNCKNIKFVTSILSSRPTNVIDKVICVFMQQD